MVETEKTTGSQRKRLRSRRAQAGFSHHRTARGGVGIGEIALQEKLSRRRVRQLVAKRLSERDRLPTEEFAELQVRRLSEALLVSYASMTGGNLKAVDRVVTIVRELDRYHGLAPTEQRVPAPLEPPLPRLALEASSQPLAMDETCGSAVNRPVSD